jgi:hypothetical protein
VRSTSTKRGGPTGSTRTPTRPKRLSSLASNSAIRLRVLDLGADRRAVLVVQRDVEHRAEPGLQLQALAHAFVDAA